MEKELLDAYDDYVYNSMQAMDALSIEDINRVVDVLYDAYLYNKTVFIMGNGGSASTSSHFACDLFKFIGSEFDKKLKVVALTDNNAIITAYANDLSYDDIFVEQLKIMMSRGDVVIGISGSGNSPNVLSAIEYALSNGGVAVGITGFDGGELINMVFNSINVPVNDMQIAEDIHLMLCHIITRLLLKRILL